MTTIDCAATIDAFGAAEWNRLFRGEIEDWSYHRAVERAALPGFESRYFGVRENGVLVAAVPAFVTAYRLDTTLEGSLRRWGDRLARLFPRLLRVRMLALGSPVGECCAVGLAPEAGSTRRAELLGLLLDAAEAHAARIGAGMLAVKDAPDHGVPWDAACAPRRLRAQPGLPTARLALPFDSVDAYLASLSAATRKDMRRKLARAKPVAIEWRRELDDATLGDAMRLYRETLARSAMRFEELTPAYFREVLAQMGGRASCVLYRHEGRLVAFNLVLHDGSCLVDKYLGLDIESARRFNLYFLSWLENVRYCIAHKLLIYQSGQAVYHDKVRLGSRLRANALWYRHRQPIVDGVFALVERWFRLDRADPDLARLLREHGA